jgi:hypothetical protein
MENRITAIVNKSPDESNTILIALLSSKPWEIIRKVKTPLKKALCNCNFATLLN